ncbi:MAG: hypothetical protein ACUVUC_14350 [Thermoguttaceae bacterium]
MPILSGKDGTVRLGQAELLEVTFWQLEKTACNRSYTANDTGGARVRVAGATDCRGRLVVQATESAKIALAEGDLVRLTLHVDGSGENFYELSAIVDSIRLQVDISEGRPVGYAIGFSGSGPIIAHGILRREG